jgi:hypothetical protein
MANRLLNYTPQMWARTALMWLKARKGMYSRVYRKFEEERKEFGKGQRINIRKPATFVAQDAPGSTAQDIKTGTAEVDLDLFREVKIKYSDLETVYAGETTLIEHVGPMIDAIAQDYDEAMFDLAATIPHTYDFADDTNVGKKFAAMRRIMVENKVPEGSELHYMASPLTMERAGGAPEFSQQQGAGDLGIATQTSGLVAEKYGFKFFETTNGPILEGDALTATPSGAVIAGTPEKNETTVTLNTGGAQTETLHEGAVIAITDTTTGITERYTITADVAPTGNNWVNVPISPRLRRDLGASSTWAIVTTVGAVGSVANYTADLAFHRNAFAAVMCELPMHEGENMFTASDAQSGLSVRARVFYDGHQAERYVVIDALGGVATLDADLALRPCVH